MRIYSTPLLSEISITAVRQNQYGVQPRYKYFLMKICIMGFRDQLLSDLRREKNLFSIYRSLCYRAREKEASIIDSVPSCVLILLSYVTWTTELVIVYSLFSYRLFSQYFVSSVFVCYRLRPSDSVLSRFLELGHIERQPHSEPGVCWTMARRRPKDYRRKVDAATRFSGVCPHTWPNLTRTRMVPLIVSCLSTSSAFSRHFLQHTDYNGKITVSGKD